MKVVSEYILRCANPPISTKYFMFYTYILHSESYNRFYVGSTENPIRRLADHNAGNTRSTKPNRPWRLIYTESFNTTREAHLREIQIKRWKNRQYMLETLHLVL
jgi:putative endonuclease